MKWFPVFFTDKYYGAKQKGTVQMKINSIETGYISIPLITPFKTALRTVSSVNDLIVKIVADDGTVGYGEAPPTEKRSDLNGDDEKSPQSNGADGRTD